MPLCLALPGLLWPPKAHRDTAHDLELPALSRLLARGRLAWSPAMPLESWLCHAFGIDGDEPPAAALRLLGAGRHPGDDIWIGADPAHLAFEHTTVAVAAIADGDIGAAATAELAATLAPLVAPLGELSLDPAGFGSLRLAVSPAIGTTPPSAALGRRADTVDVRGPDAGRWHRVANEVQMALHQHPVNQRRESRGERPLNTLWFWGAGRLPQTRPSPFDTIWGAAAAAPLLAGLAAWSQTPIAPLPANGDALLAEASGRGLAVIDRLLPATQQFDAWAWREALAALDRDWLAPLLTALHAGRLDRLTLVGLGDEGRLEVTAVPADRFRFWRPPQPFATLVPAP